MRPHYPIPPGCESLLTKYLNRLTRRCAYILSFALFFFPAEHFADYTTTVLPDSCCYHKVEVVASPFRRDYWQPPTTTTAVWTTVQAEEHNNMEQMPIKCRLISYRYYYTGCEKALMAWIRRSADVLFVLGYCVISFLKLCFLGILR